MSHSTDYVNFDDLNLDLLLEGYTGSEFESDEERDISDSAVTTAAKEVKHKLYSCDDCDRSYSSVSGIRGHLRSKHGLKNIKVSNYRKGKENAEICSPIDPFRIQEANFNEVFKQSLLQCFITMRNNTFRRNISTRGKFIVDVANNLTENSEIRDRISTLLVQDFQKLFEKASTSTENSNETLFSEFYGMSVNKTSQQNLTTILQSLPSYQTTNFRQFIGVFLHMLLRGLIESKAEIYEKQKSDVKVVTENDQQILLYIYGYMIRALMRKSERQQNEKTKALHSFMRDALQRNDCESFVTKFHKWTQHNNRGGLLIPNDSFFLMVREMEVACREYIPDRSAEKDSLQRVDLCELLVDRFMVKYYAEKLFHGGYTSFVLEQCVNLFLTVRGHAYARKRKNDIEDNCSNSKALRKSLKDSNKK